MDVQPKISRKRVANFTANEKALLVQLIRKRPIIQSKLTDGKSVAKKQAAWNSITQEYNSNVNVHKRETITLKRAWDNMKALKRKGRAAERANSLRTGGRPHVSLQPQHGALLSAAEEVVPVMMCEIKNEYDSDGAILDEIDNGQELDLLKDSNNKQRNTSVSINTIDNLKTEHIDSEDNTTFGVQGQIKSEDIQNNADWTSKNYPAVINTTDQVYRPSYYVRREYVMRMKCLENKKNMEMKILKTKLEVEQIKKKAALLEEERNKTLLEKAKIELEVLKKSIGPIEL